MIYDRELGRILISVGELVRASKYGFSHYTQGARDGFSTASPFLDFDSGEFCFRLISHRQDSGVREAELTLTAAVKSAKGKPTAEERSLARAEAYLEAMISKKLAGEEKNSPSFIKICYINEFSGAATEEAETVICKKLSDFFEKCVSNLCINARAEIERVTARLPSMRDAKFPYGQIREGQREFIKTAYRAISRGTELLATAPTGTGKTISALFPAVKAIGEGKADKAFYFTPKTTTAAAAREALELLAEQGVRVRAVILSAKERLCKNGNLCSEGHDLCPLCNDSRIIAAAMWLFDTGITVVGAEELSCAAKDFSVCPYELSLTYSELCDFIICDFNYLFDPRVYLRRYFTEGGAYAFLIDEAHNLPDRTRECYSKELSYSSLLGYNLTRGEGELVGISLEAENLARQFHSLLYPYIKDELRQDSDGNTVGAYHSRSIPEGLIPIISGFAEKLRKEILAKTRIDRASYRKEIKAMRDYLYRLEEFITASEFFDDGFEFFLFYEGEELRAKLFCLDTGKVISRRCAMGKSSVFFSATLAPEEYYRGVLGLSSSALSLNVNSPFAKEQLSVAIIESINTRYTARGESLNSACRAIAAALSAKRGHYIVFAPSYEYCSALYEAFRAKYPKIHSICQRANMTEAERRDFLGEFSSETDKYLAAFCVLGGVFSEGIDLAGDKLIGAVVVGIGIPAPSFEREAVAAYYDEISEMGKLYSYIYPGMNRVLQAAGRVIRSEDDRGTILLIDDRFRDPVYKKAAPALWGKLRFFDNPKDLKEYFEKFWED